VYDEALLESDTVTMAIQVNGKLRGDMAVAADADEQSIIAAAQAVDKVAAHLAGKTLRKTIVVPGKLVNFVVS
jgi:leucyl-tRNA synthetase